MYYQAVVWYTGEVWWEPGGQYTVGCKMDITYYPYDDQKCGLLFSFWEYTGKCVIVLFFSSTHLVKSFFDMKVVYNLAFIWSEHMV